MAEYPLMKLWRHYDGTIFQVCDEEARKMAESGGGNVFSEEISIIKVLDREEYDALPTPRPVNTVYSIRG